MSKGKRYYLTYIEYYLPRLKHRYLYGIMRSETEVMDKVLLEVKNNKFLQDKEKEYILGEILKGDKNANNL